MILKFSIIKNIFHFFFPMNSLYYMNKESLFT